MFHSPGLLVCNKEKPDTNAAFCFFGDFQPTLTPRVHANHGGWALHNKAAGRLEACPLFSRPWCPEPPRGALAKRGPPSVLMEPGMDVGS